MRWARHLRALLLGTVLLASTVTLAIAGSVESPTTTTVTTVDRQAVPDSVCVALTRHTGCYTTTTVSIQSSESSVADLFVRRASAWTGCSGVFTYSQTMYSGGLSLAQSTMQFADCYDSSGVQVTWGPYCYQKSLPGYGTGTNYCSGNGYRTFPGWANDSWYVYTWATPWWHVNNLQQVLIYPTWRSWSGCTYC